MSQFQTDVIHRGDCIEILKSLPDASVDIVYDNYGAAGTADRAMRTMKHGGTILVLPGGNGGKISKHPRADVRQITFTGTRSSAHDGLDTMAEFFDAG